MAETKDITPKDIEIIPAKEKIETLDPTQDISPTIGGLGGRLASTVTDAINVAGNLVNDVINTKLDTSAKTILGDFTFGVSGAIKMITDANNGLWLSPTGILGKKAGANTFTIGIDGIATFAGTLSAAAGTLGSITAGTFMGISIAIGTGNSIFKADANGIYLGNATFASALFSVNMAGALVASSATITGALTAAAGSVIATSYLSGLVALANENIAAQGWTSTCVLSATDYRVVAWAAGAITTAAGTAYTISAGNTGNMAAVTYIYLDIAVSTTVLQITTTATTAIGSGKILVATAVNNLDTTSKAQYQAFGGIGGVRIFVDNISANSASTNEFISNSAQLANLVVTDAKIGTMSANKIIAGTGIINALSVLATLTMGSVATDGYIQSYGWDGTVNGFQIKGGATPAVTVIGGTITGGTVQTAAAGKRIVMSGNLMEFYNATSTNIASLHGGVLGASTFLAIDVPAAAGFYPISIVQNAAAKDAIYIGLKAASHGLYIYNESTFEAIHLKGKAGVAAPLIYLEQDGTGVPLEILTTAGLNSIKINSTAEVTNQIELNVQAVGKGIDVNLTYSLNDSVGIEINHDGTGRGMYIHNDLATSINHGLLIQTAGKGYVAEFEAASNVNRTKASVAFVATSGQGAHLNLNPIADAPASPTTGDIYYDTDTHFYGWNGAAWKQLDNA